MTHAFDPALGAASLANLLQRLGVGLAWSEGAAGLRCRYHKDGGGMTGSAGAL